jgi:glyoxylase-like metal-dependent hydrolase (beta-lactamase superfamily II)
MVLTETPLGPRLAVFSLGGDTPLTSYGANCVAFAGAAGTLVVDPLIAPAHARLVAEAIERRGFPPVTHAVVTHHHTDHALGAGWFAARGAAVVAHERCAAAMAAEHPGVVAERRRTPGLEALFADAEPHLPAVAFAGSHRVDLGGVAALVRHLGPGHTPGDCVVLFPSEDAVACGDLVFSRYHFNYTDADLTGLPGALAALRALPAARFIPGHGAPAGPEAVDAQAAYHERVGRLARAAGSRAEGRAAIRDAHPGFALEIAIESALTRLAGFER